MNRAVFLDRDGTLNYDYGYIHNIDDFKFIPNVIKGLRLLQNTDFKLFIITNQSGIARGIYTKDQSINFSNHLINKLLKHNIKIYGLYFCPHHPDENCSCRKPKTMLLEKAAKEHNIDLKRSYIIGDMNIDVKMGNDAGAKTILVLTGRKGHDKEFSAKPSYTAEHMLDAIKYILRENEQ